MPEYREFSERAPDKKVPKNVWLIGGGLAILVVAYMYKKNKSQAAPTDASIDPATGLPYAQETGFGGSLNSAAGTTPSAYSYIDPATGQILSGTGGPSGTVPIMATNAQWFQAAMAYLIANGWDAITVSTTLGKYLAGGPNGTGATVTSNEMDLIHAAWAAEGKPPQAPADPHLPVPGGQRNPLIPRVPVTSFPPAVRKGLHRIGRVGQSYTWQSQATRYHTTVAILQSLNPHLPKNRNIPGGFPLITPS